MSLIDLEQWYEQMTSAPITSPENEATAETELDASSLSAIRSILTEEVAPAPRSKLGRGKSVPEPVEEVARVRRKADILPDLASAEAINAMVEVAPKAKRGFSLRRKPAKAKKTLAKPTAVKAKAGPVDAFGEAEAGIVDRIRAYRPTAKHVAFAAIALFVFMRPWLVFGLLAFFIIVMIGVFLIAGYDGFWHGVVKVSRWYATRRPSRAAILHARLDSFAVRWDAILDRFPEGTVDGLYLPDFAELASADARHDEVVERRLAGMQEKGA